jgi:N-acyl-D-amino-acid deacylase
MNEASDAADRSLDYVIDEVLIVDGTGAPGFRGSVGVRGDAVTILRSEEVAAAIRRIDGRGLIAVPGFIDSHSHSEVELANDPHYEAKTRQGVTTEILGADGLSLAPIADRATFDSYVEHYIGVTGAPHRPLANGSFGQTLEQYDGAAINVGSYVGGSALRLGAMGWSNGRPDDRAMSAMVELLDEALGAGAHGFSTGLDYSPGKWATTDELVRLAEVAAAHGVPYHTHVRYSLGDGYLDPFREAIEIGERSGAAVHITHFSNSARSLAAKGAGRLLGLVEDAAERGVEVTFDAYPYAWGANRLARLLPDWMDDAGPAEFRERLLTRTARARIREDVESSPAYRFYGASRPFADVRLTGLTAPSDVEANGSTLAEYAAVARLHVADAICDLVERNPTAHFTRLAADLATLWKFVCHPLGFIASDSVFVGGGHSPRSYGTFPMILQSYVREEGLLSLETAVHKMTGMPARMLGLTERGVLRDGAKADIAVIDLEEIDARSTFERPRELAQGVRYLFVNGRLVIDDGASTGEMPGRVVRRSAPVPSIDS